MTIFGIISYFLAVCGIVFIIYDLCIFICRAIISLKDDIKITQMPSIHPEYVIVLSVPCFLPIIIYLFIKG